MNNIVFIVDQIGPIIVDEEYNDFRTFLTAHKLTGNLRYTFSKFYQVLMLAFHNQTYEDTAAFNCSRSL